MKLLLIDGNSIMNRGYYALPKTLTAKNGIHTNAVLGFLNIFFKVYDEEKPTHIIVAFDVHEPTFRHKVYSEYKGTRQPMDPELREQFPLIKDILTKMKITYVEKGGYEADDIIGTYSRQAIKKDMDVTILSGDRDLLQLATDKVLVRIPKTKGGQTTVENYYDKDVIEEYGVTPLEFIEMKGLMGDTSDNIPGVQGIGPKTASNIIQKYHSIEAALEDIDNIKPDKARKNLDEQREMALFSRDLATIKLDCELDKGVDASEVTLKEILGQDSYDFFLELGMKTMLKRYDAADTDTEKTGEIDLRIEDISYNELVELVNKEKPEAIGLGIFPINSEVTGGAVSFSDKTYIVRESSISGIRKDIDSDVVISMISLKDYIQSLGLQEEDKLFDCSVAAYLLDPLASNYTYDLIGFKYLSHTFEDQKTLIGKEELTFFSYDTEGYRKLISYMSYVSEKLYSLLMKELSDNELEALYKEIEYPTIFVLNSMENYGIGIDKDALISYGNELDLEISRLTDEIYEAAGEEFNINSPKQLGVMLFEKMGLKAGKKTKSGYSTSADVLLKLKDENPIIPLIIDYRKKTKLKSTYIEGFMDTIRKDGRIHSRFNQTVTATGRLSSTEPNLQNIPARTAEGREIRKAFVPEEGFVFVDADYSQIELRVMASISEDSQLIEAFNSSKDVHSITASQVFGVPENEVTPELRRRAKAVNFGIIYGISSFGLGEDLGISRAEAKEYIEKYFVTYSKVKEYLDSCVEKAKNDGYVRTMMSRIRPIPELSSSNFMQRSFGERVAMNSPIQGTAADIIKIAMINVFRELKERKLKSRLILQIHDELLIEAAEEEKDDVIEILRRNMEEAAKLAVPLYVDIHTGNSLYDAK